MANLACVDGRFSMGMLCCFRSGAARRVGIQVNLKSCLPQFLGILNSPQPGLQKFVIGYEAIKGQSNGNQYLYNLPRES